MQTVSRQYKEMMDSMIRKQGYMTVAVGVINQFAQSSAVLDGSFAYWSNQNTPLSNKDVNGRYATLEQNYFMADGSMLFLPENNEFAQFIQNRSCTTNDILGTITIRFDKAYEIKGFSIDFDECYPTSFKLKTETIEKTYTNDTMNFTTTDTLGETSYVQIIPIAMVGGQKRLRINKVLMGVGLNFTNDDIKSSTLKEQVNAVCEELPSVDYSLTVNDFENRFNVDDSNSFINYLQAGQKIPVSVGVTLADDTIEWLQMANVYLSSWKSQKGAMSFTAKDIFAFMTDKYTAGNKIHTRTLYDDAEAVLTAYGLEPDEYEIDECLKDITVTNPLPEASYAQCLQLIANAGRCILYQNKEGKPCIKANFATVLNPDDLTVTSVGASAWSHSGNIVKGSDYVYADMTKNFFSTDGSMVFMPEDGNYLATAFVSAEVADDYGNFKTNPSVTVKLPAGYVYYSVYVDFDGNPPKNMLVHTYRNNALVETVEFTDLNKSNILYHEFSTFDTMTLEFTKACPNDRVLVNKVSFGDLSDYTLKKQDMLEEPIGYKEAQNKAVSVRVFTFANDEQGKPQANDDSVYYTQNLASVGNTVTFENQLISTQEHAQDVAEWLGNYYKNNTSYNVKYRGEPRLNAADIIYMDSDVINNLQVEIESNTFTFNGSFGGTLELRHALRMMG